MNSERQAAGDHQLPSPRAVLRGRSPGAISGADLGHWRQPPRGRRHRVEVMSMSRARHLSIALCLAIYAALSGVIIYTMITRWPRATTLVTAVLHWLMLL